MTTKGIIITSSVGLSVVIAVLTYVFGLLGLGYGLFLIGVYLLLDRFV